MSQSPNLQEFQKKCRGMDPNTLGLVANYLKQMIEADKQSKNRSTHLTFSYPERGGKNDGNPALQAILSILPNHKLVVSENEYTKARAIWLCEDFRVCWSKKASEGVLQTALQIVSDIEDASVCAVEKAPPPTPQDVRKTIAAAHYRATANEDPKVAQIMTKKNADGTSTVMLVYRDVEYTNAMDWMTKAFGNSGKSIPSVQIFKQPSSAESTPRPKRYVPPSSKCSFGQYI
jgi:hypothetical protein